MQLLPILALDFYFQLSDRLASEPMKDKASKQFSIFSPRRAKESSYSPSFLPSYFGALQKAIQDDEDGLKQYDSDF